MVTRGHSWSTRGHSWSLVVIRGHLWSLVCTFRHDPKFVTSSMARASVSSMKICSRFPSPIILFYTKSIIIPVCRLRLVGYLLKLGLAVNQVYLCRETKYGTGYGKVKDYTKNLMAQSILSVTIPSPPTRHLSFSRVGHLSSVVCPGMGHLSPIYSNRANFTFLLLNFCLFY